LFYVLATSVSCCCFSTVLPITTEQIASPASSTSRAYAWYLFSVKTSLSIYFTDFEILLGRRDGFEVLWWIYLFVCLSVSAYVCLSVYLSVCLPVQIIRKPHDRTSPNFLCKLPVAVGCSVLLWRRCYTLYVFPVLWMTSCFHIRGIWRVMCIPKWR